MNQNLTQKKKKRVDFRGLVWLMRNRKEKEKENCQFSSQILSKQIEFNAKRQRKEKTLLTQEKRRSIDETTVLLIA